MYIVVEVTFKQMNILWANQLSLVSIISSRINSEGYKFFLFPHAYSCYRTGKVLAELVDVSILT